MLAPIAVNPGLQQKGIGKLLMNELEKRAKRFDYGFISILGHPGYYVKFGYGPASEYNIYPPFEGIPDEAFMIKEIQEGYLKNKEGTILNCNPNNRQLIKSVSYSGFSMP
ncbi:GNAT family N-acetyltransferase [Jeotgalicoccus nanhaiensis]|uniref:GNAT family N-acetyltransferase n=1 Tax=Jeotgalicoccus nanhaiensis TaxID=568603 RepID=UPI003A0FD3E5